MNDLPLLKVGDKVLTLDGKVRAIEWIRPRSTVFPNHPAVLVGNVVKLEGQDELEFEWELDLVTEEEQDIANTGSK